MLSVITGTDVVTFAVVFYHCHRQGSQQLLLVCFGVVGRRCCQPSLLLLLLAVAAVVMAHSNEILIIWVLLAITVVSRRCFCCSWPSLSSSWRTQQLHLGRFKMSFTSWSFTAVTSSLWLSAIKTYFAKYW